MANHKSAIKRHRQNPIRAARNHTIKSELRTLVKKVRISIDEKKADEALTHLPAATRALDRAVTRGVMKRNSASRRISRLTRQVAALSND